MNRTRSSNAPPARDQGPPRSGFRRGFTIALFGAFAFLLWVTLNDPVRKPQMSTETALRETIYLTALALDAEREATGAYPATLEAVAMDEDGLTYIREGDGYRLVASADGVTVDYESGEDLTPFRAAFQQLLPPHLRIER